MSATATGPAGRALLWLFVINLGTAFGAGIFEHRILLPAWLAASDGSGPHWNADAARRFDTGLRFWVFVTTVPLTLITLGNAIAASRAARPLRRWWGAASGVALVERASTFGYFIPGMVALMAAPDSAESVEKATRWSALNYGRHALTLTAWLLALKAFAVAYEGRCDTPQTRSRDAIGGGS